MGVLEDFGQAQRVELGDFFEAVEVDVVEGAIGVGDRVRAGDDEGGGDDFGLDAESAGEALDEGGFAGTQFAREGDDTTSVFKFFG